MTMPFTITMNCVIECCLGQLPRAYRAFVLGVISTWGKLNVRIEERDRNFTSTLR